MLNTMLKRLRCTIGLHRWTTRANGNVSYEECVHCGKYRKQGAMANRFPPGGMGDSGGGM
jgi:ferredoxin-like protein FixX